jgi:hypothetical protein
LTSIELEHLAILQIPNEDGEQYTDEAVGGIQHAEDYCQFSVEVAVGREIELACAITGRHAHASKEVMDGLSSASNDGVMRYL